MALTIGELTGRVSLDDAPFGQGVDRAEGRFRGLAGRLGPIGRGIGATTGAVMGGALTMGLAGNLEMGSAVARMNAQLGTAGPVSAKLGQVAGNLYSQAYGASMGEVTEAVRQVQTNIRSMGSASAADLQTVTGQVMSLASAFGQDLGGTTRAVDKMITTGLAPNAQVAMDVLARGFQVGNDQAGDLLDTFSEYSTQFRVLGVDGAGAMGLIRQGLQGGARDADTVADSLKEFAIRAVDGSKTTAEGFQAIGLNAGDMAKKIAAGGPVAAGALDMTLDRLRAMPDPVARSQAAVALFGTKAEDLGDALFSLDPSAAVGALGQVGGAAAGMDATLRDTAETRIESVKRSIQTWAMDLANLPGPMGTAGAAVVGLGGQFAGLAGPLMGAVAAQRAAGAASRAAAATQAAAGATQRAGMLATVASTVWGWTTMAASATAGAIKTGAAWLLARGVGMTAYLASLAMAVARTVVTWAIMGATAAAGAIRTAAAWLLATGAGMATYLAGLAIAVAGTVAGWAMMGLQALLGAARVAAAWFIALGPIGWVIAAVIGVVALIIANWDTVKAWTLAAWSAVTAAIGAAWAWIKGLVVGAAAAVVGFVVSAWTRAKTMTIMAWNLLKAAVSAGIAGVIGFVRALPGRILSTLGNLGALLLGAGRAIMDGFLRGLKAAWEKVKGFVGGIASWISDHKGPITYDARVLRPHGRAFMSGLGAGFGDGEAPLLRRLNRVTERITVGTADGLGAGSSSSAMELGDVSLSSLARLLESRPVSVVIDGREVARTVNARNGSDRRLEPAGSRR